MKIPAALLKILGKQERTLPEIDDYLDLNSGVWCLGDIPANLRQEIAADIRCSSGQARPFSEAYLREVVSDQEGFEVVKFALQFFLSMAVKIIGTKQPGRDSSLYPWVKALCISPDISVNASAQLAIDTKATTVFLTINAGVFVQQAHRLLAMFADEQFIQDLSKPPVHRSGETVEKVPDAGKWCKLKSDNSNLRLVAAWITTLAAMLVFYHEQAHFYRGHLGFIRERRGELKLLEVVDIPAQRTSDDDDLRRLLEFDADHAGGVLYGVVMREFDHPVPGPADGKNERFLVLTIVAAASMFIAFEEKMASRRYYPPAWRIHHFMNGFMESFFSQPMPDQDRAFLTETVFTVMQHVEARYANLSWHSEFDMGAAVAQNEMFFRQDIPGRTELEKEFKDFMPHLWPKERKHNR